MQAELGVITPFRSPEGPGAATEVLSARLQDRGVPDGDTDTEASAQATAGPAEWYSPSWIVELARDTLGAIDCDPASDATAQEVVRAGVTFGIGRPDAEGGLSPDGGVGRTRLDESAVWQGRLSGVRFPADCRR